MPILMHLVSLFVYDVLKFLHALPKLFHAMLISITCCMIIAMWYVKITCTCCINIHLRYTKISITVVPSFLIFCVSTFICYMPTQKIYVVWKFFSGSTFAIIPYSEKLSSLAVACWSWNYKTHKPSIMFTLHWIQC